VCRRWTIERVFAWEDKFQSRAIVDLVNKYRDEQVAQPH